MLRTFGHAVVTCWMLLTQVWPRLNLSYKHASATCRNKRNTSQQGGQTLATFSTVLPPIILRYVAIRWWGLNPYSLGCPFVSPQTSSEFESKMALAWWKYACSPKYALSTGYCWFSHDVTKFQTSELLILLRFYFHDELEQLKTNIQTNFHSERVLGLVIDYAWISKLLRDVAFTRTGARAVMLV